MLCRHIGLLVSKRMDTILLHHRIRKHPDSPSIRYRTRCGLIFFFHSGDRIQKYPDSLLSSPNGCGLKPYPEKKYPDTCGRRHRLLFVSWKPRGRWLELGKMLI